MTVNSELRKDLEKHLDDKEISEFEKGELCLFMTEPKYAFFRLTDDGFQRADVVRDHSPDSDAVMRIYHEVYETTPDDILERAKKQDEINAYPVEIGFEDL